mgnify:CR=1 FL=1
MLTPEERQFVREAADFFGSNFWGIIIDGRLHL